MTTTPAYRLVKRRFAAAAFDGEGARRYGGRWNSKGRRCVYAAGSESLAMLEILVHLGRAAVLDHYTLYRAHIPTDAILHLAGDDLPDNWRDYPAPPETAIIGDGWLDARTSLALAVPSVVAPREHNYLLNPAHADFAPLTRSLETLDFAFDERFGDE